MPDVDYTLFDPSRAPLCAIKDCPRKAAASKRGLCQRCHRERKLAGLPLPPDRRRLTPIKTCATPGCDRTNDKHAFNGVRCNMHYRRRRKAQKLAAGELCSVDNCEKPAVARGLCGTHRIAARAAGDLDLVPAKSLKERFFGYAVPGKYLDDCWGWNACVNQKGYGVLRVGRTTPLAHVISYELHHGPVPPGMVVMHACPLVDGKRPNKACTNPLHLRIGTHAENTQDDDTGKLTPSDVHLIRYLACIGVSLSRIADAVAATGGQRVSIGMIGFIRRGESWATLPTERPDPERLRAALEYLKS